MLRSLIEVNHATLSVRKQCALLNIHRSGIYYVHQSENPFNLMLMRKMDEWMLEDPRLGVISIVDLFKDEGIVVNPKRIRPLMRLMGLMAIYPKKYLSVLGETQYVYHYLLRGLSITRANQVWAIDITYIPMRKGFMYLTAIIDVYSRKMMSWGLSNSLSNECILELLDQGIGRVAPNNKYEKAA